MAVPPTAPLGERVSPGASDQHLLDYIGAKGFRRVFLVTGHRSFSWFENNNFIHRLSQVSAPKRWADARPNPEFHNLKRGLEAVSAHTPDVIIGIGGGSVMDMAKLLAALSNKPKSDLAALTGGSPGLDKRGTHLVLVPTTAGSGAEATHFSVLYREGVKYSIAGEGLLPDHIVLDPELIKSGDSNQLAASGLDALCQCVESIWARGATSQSKDLAIAGLRSVSESLVAFVERDKRFAEPMQWGSHLAGHAINTSKTTAPHALSYFLTTHLGVPHGVAVASTLGYFLEHHMAMLRGGGSLDSGVKVAIDAIREGLGLSGRNNATKYFRDLFDRLGLDQPRQYWPQDAGAIEAWIRSANPERLGNHPLALDEEALYRILGLTLESD